MSGDQELPIVLKLWAHDAPNSGMDTTGAPEEAADVIKDLYNGCNALLGLLQLLSHRDDVSDDLRGFLTSGHRIDEAEKAVAKARGEQVSA
jgi:hypothetical protein